MQIRVASSIFAAAFLSGTAIIMINGLPIFVGAATEGLSLNSRGTGNLVSLYFAGHSVLTLVLPMLIRRLNWRRVGLVGSALGGLGLATGANLTGMSHLGMSLFLVGACGGALYVTAVTALTDASDPERGLGWAMVWQLGLGVVVVISCPSFLIPRWGFSGAMYGLAVVFFAGMIAARYIPIQGHKHGDSRRQATELNVSALAGLLATFVFFTGATANWVFLERLGDARGITAQTIGLVLALALFAGGAAGLLVSALGSRAGYLTPITICVVILIAAASCIYLIDDRIAYMVGVIVYQFAWAGMVTYLMAIVAHWDTSGGIAPYLPAIIGMASATGASIVGGLVAGGFLNLLIFLVTMTILTLLILHWAAWKQGRASTQ